MGSTTTYTPLLLILFIPGLAQTQQVSGDPLTDNNQYLEYMFDRPMEPIFMPKGPRENVVFKLPVEYLPRRFRPLISEIEEKLQSVNATEIVVPRIQLPDLTLPLELGRREHFSNFVPFHRMVAHSLVEILMNQDSYEKFFSTAVYCRPRINPYLYVYALSVAIIHRPDTRNVRLPLQASVFPEKFFSGEIFSLLREQATIVRAESRTPIEISQDYTASDLEPEHRLAYFREDLGINMHHWRWHIAYPVSGPREVVNKDRRGELFYYFHAQIMARYNFERFSNQLSRAKRLINWYEPIKEGYFPKLDTLVASRVYPPRQAYSKLRDINRGQTVFDIQDLIRWRDRIYGAIHTGKVRNEQGQIIPLSPDQGIDILGDMVEATILSVDRNYYGDMHNLGHVAISYIHDPDNRHLEPGGVMGDTTTSMRDPIFYRWHAFVNDIFLEHKHTLPRYTTQQLGFDGVRISDFQLISEGNRLNAFFTHWQKSDLDLSRGLDFAPGGPLVVRITHLQHRQFTYHIQVDNMGQTRIGTVRIFMAPLYDERGQRLSFQDQKTLYIELDKFQITLRPGRNIIDQTSAQSSVTTPYEYTFQDLSATGTGEPTTDSTTTQFNYFGCGWPDHMLIPKGKTEGLPAQLFVMVSNYIDDRVEERPSSNTCQDGHSYCGIRGQLYPDRRPMGFPFDRLPRRNVHTVEDFLLPNMAVKNVTIYHSDVAVIGPTRT